MQGLNALWTFLDGALKDRGGELVSIQSLHPGEVMQLLCVRGDVFIALRLGNEHLVVTNGYLLHGVSDGLQGISLHVVGEGGEQFIAGLKTVCFCAASGFVVPPRAVKPEKLPERFNGAVPFVDDADE